jgi:peptidoglycan/LPS O-acetylase OafA/YrhL
MSGEQRSPFIDYLKAAAIVAVVAQHAIIPRWHPTPPIEDHVFRPFIQFHVPAFLFASGYLYYSAKALSLSDLFLRLRRVLPPFVIASVFWVIFKKGSSATLVETLRLVAIAEALPIYYYVHLIIECIACMWLISHLPARANIGLFAILLLVGASLNWFPAYNPLPRVYGQLRNPLIYVPFFIAGWAARQCSDLWKSLDGFHVRCVAIAAFTVLIALLYVYFGLPKVWQGSWILFRAVFSLTVVALIASLSGSSPAPRVVVFLAAASYTIYLYHFPVVISLQKLMLVDDIPVLRFVLLTVAGLATGSAITVVGSRVLGRRSADMVGTYWR